MKGVNSVECCYLTGRVPRTGISGTRRCPASRSLESKGTYIFKWIGQYITGHDRGVREAQLEHKAKMLVSDLWYESGPLNKCVWLRWKTAQTLGVTWAKVSRSQGSLVNFMARAKVGATDGANTKEGDKRPRHNGLTCPAKDYRGLERQVRARRQDVSECCQDHCYSSGWLWNPD